MKRKNKGGDVEFSFAVFHFLCLCIYCHPKNRICITYFHKIGSKDNRTKSCSCNFGISERAPKMFICWCYLTSLNGLNNTPYYYLDNNAVLNKGANSVKRFSIYAINIVQMMVSAIKESQFESGLIRSSTHYWVDFSWASDSLWRLWLDSMGSRRNWRTPSCLVMLACGCWTKTSARGAVIPEGQTTSRTSMVMHQPCKKMASFLVDSLCFFVYLDDCLPFPGLGQKESETWLLRFSAVSCQWKSLTEVTSFVFQPPYNTHKFITHGIILKNIVKYFAYILFFCYNHFKMYFEDIH